MTRSRRLSIVMAGAGLTLAGCGLPGQNVAQPPPLAAGAHLGGTITIGITAPAGVAPPDAYEPPGELISSLLCDPLISLDPKTGTPKPGLVESWQYSSGLLTLKLRHNLRTATGTTLTAADVADSLSALANPTNASREAGLMREVGGYEELSSNLFAASNARLAGITVVDPFDLQVEVQPDDPGFVSALTQPAAAPYTTASAADPTKFAADPGCVGPYTLASPFRPDQTQIVLVRNPNYYKANVAFSGGGRGYADKLIFNVYPSQDAAYRAFLAGQVDVAQVPPDRTSAATPPGADRVTGADGNEEFIGLPDGLQNDLNSPSVHLALSEALNRTALTDSIWPGTATPATGYLPPGFGGAADGTDCGPATPATADPTAARAALSASALAALDSAPLTFYVDADGTNVKEANAIAGQWRSNLGLHVTVEQLSWSDYAQKANVGSGFDGPFRISWSANATSPIPTWLDPAAFLGPLFLSTQTQTGNWSHYQSGTFDTEFDNDAQPASGLSRTQNFQSLAKSLCTTMPIIPVAFGQTTWLFNHRLASARNAELTPSGTPLLREIYVR